MNKTILVWIGIIAALLFCTYFTAIEHLLQRFDARDSYYSHGYMVPFISAYLVWRKRKELAILQPQGSLWGLPLIVAGLLVHIISYFLKINFTSYASFLVVLFGISLFLGGWKITRVFLFPLIFLIFMMPLPRVAILGISFEMKLLASEISSWLINLMGIETSVSGSRIFYPGGFVLVGDPCSGLRSLISFLALGTVVVQLTSGNVWKKSILFFSVIPIALFSNVIRIIVLTLASYIYGNQIIEGFFHDFMGIMVFVIGFIGLVALMNILKCHLSLETA
mgnify:CR=1 FL=1